MKESKYIAWGGFTLRDSHIEEMQERQRDMVEDCTPIVWPVADDIYPTKGNFFSFSDPWILCSDSKLAGDVRNAMNNVSALTAELAAFREAVVVLPVGAGPEVGDMVTDGYLLMWFTKFDQEDWPDEYKKTIKIIQRNGKPYLYETDLIKPTEKPNANN